MNSSLVVQRGSDRGLGSERRTFQRSVGGDECKVGFVKFGGLREVEARAVPFVELLLDLVLCSADL